METGVWIYFKDGIWERNRTYYWQRWELGTYIGTVLILSSAAGWPCANYFIYAFMTCFKINVTLSFSL